jgi:hypothetical protein
VFLTPLLDGLQNFGISARLPVRHARLLYSLASGVSWYVSCCFASLSALQPSCHACTAASHDPSAFRALLDVFTDTSKSFQYDPLSSLYSSLVTSAATNSSSSTTSGRVLQVSAAQGTIGSAQNTLTIAAQQTLQDVKGAWQLGYVRILTFLIATATVTVLHGGLLVLWASSPLLSHRILPTFLAFPRLELMLVFTFMPGKNALQSLHQKTSQKHYYYACICVVIVSRTDL